MNDDPDGLREGAARFDADAPPPRSRSRRLLAALRDIVEIVPGEPDSEIAKRIDADERAARQPDILHSVPGLGQIATAAILTFLPEIGALDRRQVGSLAGLVPCNRDSGRWKGKSFISGGRKPLRDALTMSALVAMRHNPDLKVKYENLRAAGKPAKLAIVAFVGKTAPHAVFWSSSLRKLIETANALVKADRTRVEKTA